jgi:Chromatin assembly factor 1 subunit A
VDVTRLHFRRPTNILVFCFRFARGNIELHLHSSLPLKTLVSKVCTELEQVHGRKWSSEAVSAKIKLLAKRKAHFESIGSHINDVGTTTRTATTCKVLDLFEDTDLDRLWRWEITALELLPSECAADARKARSARRKISSKYSAIAKLIKSLDEALKLILDPKLPEMDQSIAKISCNEEKVLKFEREAEKLRIAEEAKARKLREMEAKKRAKEEDAEEKRRQKEEIAEEKKRLKEESARVREDAKRRKEIEKEQKDAEMIAKARQEQMKLIHQKTSFVSFFAAPSARVEKKVQEKSDCPEVVHKEVACDTFDVDVFRSMINTSKSVSFPSFTNRFCKSRTKKVSVSIYTTRATAEEEWDAQPYAELQTIEVPNKYRFLSFHEDCRPAYHGTWSKRSSNVTGKTPFGKETSVFDYEYDRSRMGRGRRRNWGRCRR